MVTGYAAGGERTGETVPARGRHAWRGLAPEGARFAAGALAEARRLAAFFRRHPADLIHVFDGEGAVAPLAARLAGYPCVIAHYGTLPDAAPESAPVARAALNRLSFECLDDVIVKTRAAARIWARSMRVSERRFAAIPNGLELGSYEGPPDPAPLRERFGLKESDLVVGLSARLDPVKGHRYLIDAAAAVRARVPNAVFVLAGNGPLRDALKERTRRLGLEGVVRFVGYQADIVPLTWLYDVAVLPSVTETFGWAVVEAMACRKPVVASALPAVAEVMRDGETGVLVPARDPEALAGALVGLLEDPVLRERMGEAGRRRVEQEFTIQRMRQETYALYDRHLGARARTPALGAWLTRLGRLRRTETSHG